MSAREIGPFRPQVHYAVCPCSIHMCACVRDFLCVCVCFIITLYVLFMFHSCRCILLVSVPIQIRQLANEKQLLTWRQRYFRCIECRVNSSHWNWCSLILPTKHIFCLFVIVHAIHFGANTHCLHLSLPFVYIHHIQHVQITGHGNWYTRWQFNIGAGTSSGNVHGVFCRAIHIVRLDAGLTSHARRHHFAKSVGQKSCIDCATI